MDPMKEEQQLHSHRFRCHTWQTPEIAVFCGDRDTSSVTVDYLCARAGDRSQQGKPLLLKLDKPLSFFNKNHLRGCSPRAAASSACSPQPSTTALLLSHQQMELASQQAQTGTQAGLGEST